MAEITEIAMMRTLAHPVDAADYLLYIVKTLFSSVTNFLLDHILRILLEPLCLLHKGHLNKTMPYGPLFTFTQRTTIIKSKGYVDRPVGRAVTRFSLEREV